MDYVYGSVTLPVKYYDTATKEAVDKYEAKYNSAEFISSVNVIFDGAMVTVTNELAEDGDMSELTDVLAKLGVPFDSYRASNHDDCGASYIYYRPGMVAPEQYTNTNLDEELCLTESQLSPLFSATLSDNEFRQLFMDIYYSCFPHYIPLENS